MNIIILLIVCSFSLAIIFLMAFIWWINSGQSDDLETPGHRILFDNIKKNPNK